MVYNSAYCLEKAHFIILLPKREKPADAGFCLFYEKQLPLLHGMIDYILRATL